MVCSTAAVRLRARRGMKAADVDVEVAPAADTADGRAAASRRSAGRSSMVRKIGAGAH